MHHDSHQRCPFYQLHPIFFTSLNIQNLRIAVSLLFFLCFIAFLVSEYARRIISPFFYCWEHFSFAGDLRTVGKERYFYWFQRRSKKKSEWSFKIQTNRTQKLRFLWFVTAMPSIFYYFNRTPRGQKYPENVVDMFISASLFFWWSQNAWEKSQLIFRDWLSKTCLKNKIDAVL